MFTCNRCGATGDPPPCDHFAQPWSLDRIAEAHRELMHVCNDGWICEEHPEQGWPHDDCAGPGMPCPICNNAPGRPRLPEDWQSYVSAEPFGEPASDDGLGGLGRVEITGNWTRGALFAEMESRDVILCVESRRVLGVDFYAERRRFQALVRSAEHSNDGIISCAFQPTTPVLVERAEWWRRAVFAIVRRLPSFSRSEDI